MTTLLAVLLLAQAESAPPPSPSPPDPVPLYTNDDLERVRPFRAETGVASVPAFAPAAAGSRSRPAATPRVRGEEYWRKEAARVRERVASLRAQAEELRATLAEREARRRHTLGRSRDGGASEARLEARLAGIERRIRLVEDELRERARRQGALPGWLR